MEILCKLLTIYLFLLLAAVVVSWFRAAGWRPTGVMFQVVQGIQAITEPVFRLVRGLLPMVRIGGMGMDLSPIIVFIVIGVLQAGVCRS